MAESPFKDFVNKLPVERKPLSKQERNDVLKVARDVWREAIEKSGGKSSAALRMEIPDGSTQIITLFMKERIAEFHPENPHTDLIINVNYPLDSNKNPILPLIIGQYRLAPNEVIKRNIDMSRQKPIDVSQFRGMDSVQYAKALERINAQLIAEEYHPDKVELAVLLKSISSTKKI